MECTTMQPLVSCITPTYGRISFLQEMYWSWRQQEYENKELIILNDEENLIITINDPRVKIFNFNERFVGLGAKRNFCVENVSSDSEYILPFDDDDLFLPDHITSLVTGLIENPPFDRSKNFRHALIRDNCFIEILDGYNRPFFGASCFRTEVMRKFKFNEHYIMGEDTTWLDSNKISTYYISRKTPTFLYRTGMNIIHASWHKMDIRNGQQQKELYHKIGNSINKFEISTEIELNGQVSKNTEVLYKNMYNLYR